MVLKEAVAGESFLQRSRMWRCPRVGQGHGVSSCLWVQTVLQASRGCVWSDTSLTRAQEATEPVPVS